MISEIAKTVLYDILRNSLIFYLFFVTFLTIESDEYIKLQFSG